jgi:SH3 domain protein
MALFRNKQLLRGRCRFLGLTLISLSLLLWGEALAGTLYVSDTTLEANVRSGTSNENRIIAMVRPGTKVTLIREEEGWAEVALEDGRTGWILARYLSDQPPWQMTAEKLTSENRQLRERLGRAESGQQQLLQENNGLKGELDTAKRELDTVRQEYEALKRGAADYLKLKAAYEQLESQARLQKDELGSVQRAYEKLRLSSNIHWFLSGAGVLILGWLVGLWMGRMRRRSKDYYRL